MGIGDIPIPNNGNAIGYRVLRGNYVFLYHKSGGLICFILIRSIGMRLIIKISTFHKLFPKIRLVGL